jgi:hypothetical protein
MKTTLIVSLALLASPLHAEPSRPAPGEAQPFPSRGNCPSGYYTSGGFCAPLNRDSKPAVPKPPGASCPSGWYASGDACRKL